jgi:hypothetical protein
VASFEDGRFPWTTVVASSLPSSRRAM